jgi:hypothetical protein
MSLTTFLQRSFATKTPDGWQCTSEQNLLPHQLEKELGFSPRVDVLLENPGLNKRIWIEFEISRADPAANHLKFAIGHLFAESLERDAFLSMVSTHVTKGRANLGASTIFLMRRLGIKAFQTPLLPHLSPADIKELNHLPINALEDRAIDVAKEIHRALIITSPVFSLDDDEVYYTANELEVAFNVKQWNREMTQENVGRRWGKRTVKYFVFDRVSGLFAPSKFCAFLPIWKRQNIPAGTHHTPFSSMTVAHYCSLDQSTLRFDGGNAQKHLRRRLCYTATRLRDFPHRAQFEAWLSNHHDHVRLHGDNPIVLAPPPRD